MSARVVVAPRGSRIGERGTRDDRSRTRDFLTSLAESTLVIKSHTKTYRFKTVAVAEKADQASQLADFVASMDRFH